MNELHDLLHPTLTTNAGALWAHLWTSTLILVAGLALATLPRLGARRREMVLSLALAKLALPGTAALVALRLLGLDLVALLDGPGPGSGVPAVSVSGPVTAFTATPTSELACGLIAAAVLGAAVVALARTAIGWRAMRQLLAGATPAPPELQALVERTARELGHAGRVRALRSPAADAPFAYAMSRPTVVLPAVDLPPEVLRPVLAHELEHLARHDGLRAMAVAALTTTCWFHPLVWVAARRLAFLREAACDERAAAVVGTRSYLAALATICSPRAAYAGGLHGVAGGGLNERIALMKSPVAPLRHPRTTLAAAILVLAASTVVSGFAAPPRVEKGSSGPYEIKLATVTRTPVTGAFQIELEVRERQSGAVVFAPRLEVAPGQPASVETTSGDRTWRVDVDSDSGRQSALRFTATSQGETVQEEAIPFVAIIRAVKQGPAEPIAMSLRDAPLSGVLRSFGRMTGKELVGADTVQGSVTVELQDVPWPEALDQLAREHGFTWRVDGDTLYIEQN